MTQISYLYFCTLGGIAHGRTFTVNHCDGRGDYIYTTYHLIPKEY